MIMDNLQLAPIVFTTPAEDLSYQTMATSTFARFRDLHMKSAPPAHTANDEKAEDESVEAQTDRSDGESQHGSAPSTNPADDPTSCRSSYCRTAQYG